MALVRFTRRPSRVAFPAGTTNLSTFPTFDDLENRMSRFIDRALSEPFGSSVMTESLGWMPAMEIVESPKELTLTAELPGIDEKNIDVSVEDGVITIRGEKEAEKKEDADDKKVYLYERSYGSFFRSFSLPPGVDSSKTTAQFDKGVLKVHIPKTAEAAAKGHKVEIKST